MKIEKYYLALGFLLTSLVACDKLAPVTQEQVKQELLIFDTCMARITNPNSDNVFACAQIARKMAER